MSEKLLDDDFIARLEQLELVSRKVISGVLKGDRLSKRRGHSMEFADFRPYVEGDDLRFLDWNAFGRLDRLFLKIFLEEEDLRVRVLIDRSASMDYGEPNKFHYAKQIAAALSYIGLIHQDRVEINVFGESVRPLFGPARGRRHTRRLFDVLESATTDELETTDLARACREFSHSQKGGGIVLFVSDFLDRAGYEKALRYLLVRARSTEIYVFHILAPEEIDPKLVGDLRLVDVEDGVPAEVSVSAPLIKQYRRTVDAFREEIQEFCSQRGMHYVFASTAVPFDRLILEYLRRRGLVK